MIILSAGDDALDLHEAARAHGPSSRRVRTLRWVADVTSFTPFEKRVARATGFERSAAAERYASSAPLTVGFDTLSWPW